VYYTFSQTIKLFGGKRIIDACIFIKEDLIITENKSLGRLCKMCNLFFYELQIVSYLCTQARLLYCYYTTEVKGWMIDPGRRLDQLNRRRGAGAHNLFYD